MEPIENVECNIVDGVEEGSTHWNGVERRRNKSVDTEPRFKLTLSTLAQVGLMLMTTGIAFAYLKADVEKLKADQVTIQSFQGQNYQILLKVTELQTQMGGLRDEMKYYRERLDQEIQRSRSAGK